MEGYFWKVSILGLYQILGFPFLETLSLSPLPRVLSLSPRFTLGLTSPAPISLLRPPRDLPPPINSSPPPPLPNPTSLGAYRRRKRPESPSTRPTATAKGNDLGLSVSGQIGRNTYGDLEAHNPRNPAPPAPTKSMAGRRRKSYMNPATHIGFRGSFRPFPVTF